MKLTADFHTHTVFSHGKGTILDNALEAQKKGLLELAITDHGHGHTVYGIKSKKIPYMKELCESASKQTGVKVLLGVEANILGISGKTDMKERDMEHMDIYLAGIHKMIAYDKLKEWVMLFGKNFTARHFHKPSKSLIKRNTEVYINAIKQNPIDILTHPGFCAFINAYDVARCCEDYGTLFEIDARKKHLEDDEWESVLKTNVKFVIDSDAHSPEKIGVIGQAEELIKRVGIPTDRIVNIDGKLPKDLRFTSFKRKM
ncbi:MAG: PHP domain-containing protein [Clostridia bacterium]|nr:PHP domain-containing protein [Clostridia bacterium]